MNEKMWSFLRWRNSRQIVKGKIIKLLYTSWLREIAGINEGYNEPFKNSLYYLAEKIALNEK